ncbi:MAG TPA: molybdopterin-binding protein [Rudaea sp.]|jgi:DMSO/TMAO reductase YedYZ molybdopterin-dependent catalytic subunit
MTSGDERRRFLVRIGSLGGSVFLAGCDRLSQAGWFAKTLGIAETINRGVQHLITPRRSMAQEFSTADLSPEFRSNGTFSPNDPKYKVLAEGDFIDYRLTISGLVESPASFSLADLRALPDRTQITRHDCVEGWSAIGKWRGAKLGAVLERVRPKPTARFVVFLCADPMDSAGTKYYESIDMEDAYHPQTILAYDLNDRPLPIPNGAPIRARIERQLGYKMAKYIMAIELVDDFASIGGGNGGYWEDQGYDWYAGI